MGVGTLVRSVDFLVLSIFFARDPQEVEAAHLKEDVVVQSVSALLQKGVPLPSWLDGTPILVDTSTNEALKGSAAVQKI